MISWANYFFSQNGQVWKKIIICSAFNNTYFCLSWDKSRESWSNSQKLTLSLISVHLFYNDICKWLLQELFHNHIKIFLCDMLLKMRVQFNSRIGFLVHFSFAKWLVQNDFNNISASFQNLFVVVFTWKRIRVAQITHIVSIIFYDHPS